LSIKYTKSVLWRVAKRLSYTGDARFPKFKFVFIARLQSIVRATHSKSHVFYALFAMKRNNTETANTREQ